MATDLLESNIREIEKELIANAYSVFDENLSNRFETLCKTLKEFFNRTTTHSHDENYEVTLQLKRFQTNLIRHLISRHAPETVASFSNNILDIFLHQTMIEMEISHVISDIYFDLSLKWLTDDDTINYILEIRPNNPLDDHFLQIFCEIGNYAMWNKIKKCSGISVMRKKIPTFFPKNETTDRLIRGFLGYLDRHIWQNPITKTQALIFIWVQGMMDIIAFVPFFINAGYPETIVKWLSIETSSTAISFRVWRETLDLIHNIARHEAGIKALNELEIMPVLKKWKDRYLSEPLPSSEQRYEDLIMLYYMNYALLLEPGVLKQEDPIDIQLAIDYILKLAMEAFKSPTLRCGPYNVSEFWDPLAKLSVNDKCLQYILARENIFEFLLEKFLEFNRHIQDNVHSELFDLHILVCSLFYSLFWSISFQPCYHEQLKSSREFIEFTKKNAKNDSNDELLTIIRRSANGILFNLDMFQEILLEKYSEKDQNDGVRVMISYSHKDGSFCRTLVKHLEKRIQGDIWVDFIKLEPPYDDDWDEIAGAITHCDVIVMIVTGNYCSSKSCRREVIHADKRNKPMIPVYQGRDYQPDDWFEIRVGSATWVRFDADKNDQDVIETLIKLINAQEKRKDISETAVIKDCVNHSEPIKITEYTNETSTTKKCQIVEESHLTTYPIDLSITTMDIESWGPTDLERHLSFPMRYLQIESGNAFLKYVRLLESEEAQVDEYEKNFRNHDVTRAQWANFLSTVSQVKTIQTIDKKSTIPVEQWSSSDIILWFDQNKLPHFLKDTLAFHDGQDLIMYAKLLCTMSNRIDSEYERLSAAIQARYNGQNLQLNVYARLIQLLKDALEKSKSTKTVSFVKEDGSYLFKVTASILTLLIFITNLLIFLKLYID